jgi:uncharacterized protein YbaR (Trm112 family)
MALEPFLLEIVVCPETRQPLKVADVALLDRLNAAIAKGRLKDRGGRPVDPALHAALVRADGLVAYPVWDDVPRLLVDGAISLEGVV